MARRAFRATARSPCRAAIFLRLPTSGQTPIYGEHGYRCATGQGQYEHVHQRGGRGSSAAYTLEMPFKDNANAPDPVFGWSPDRSAQLGASVLDALIQLAHESR